MPTPELVREFVIAGHGDLEKVTAMLAQHPDLVNAAHEWNAGAPLEICTAAMLGRRGDVERLLDADAAIHATGAHGIPLLAHAALSGDVGLVEGLFRRGAHAGVSYALHTAVTRGHEHMARWLLENGRPDLTWTNFEGKTALTVATERGLEALAALLREHGAPA